MSISILSTEINVTIQFSNGDTHILSIVKSLTILDVKLVIESVYGIPTGNCQLFNMNIDIDTTMKPLLNKLLLNNLINNTLELELALILQTDRDVLLEILNLNPHIEDRVNWSSQPERLSEWTRIKVDPNNIESITF